MDYYTVKPENEPTDAQVLEAANAAFTDNMKRWPGLYAEEDRAKTVAEDMDMVRRWLRSLAGDPLDTTEYANEPCADVMTVEEWLESCEFGGFIDYDGYGSPMKDGKVARMTISPSRRHLVPKDATHIEWYNR